MSLTNRNDRSIHGDAKRIKANLAEHGKRTAEYVAQGYCALHASKRAYDDMRNHRQAYGTCSECAPHTFRPDVGGWVR